MIMYVSLSDLRAGAQEPWEEGPTTSRFQNIYVASARSTYVLLCPYARVCALSLSLSLSLSLLLSAGHHGPRCRARSRCCRRLRPSRQGARRPPGFDRVGPRAPGKCGRDGLGQVARDGLVAHSPLARPQRRRRSLEQGRLRPQCRERPCAGGTSPSWAGRGQR